VLLIKIAFSKKEKKHKKIQVFLMHSIPLPLI
jgi:hypothetical protein